MNSVDVLLLKVNEDLSICLNYVLISHLTLKWYGISNRQWRDALCAFDVKFSNCIALDTSQIAHLKKNSNFLRVRTFALNIKQMAPFTYEKKHF